MEPNTRVLWCVVSVMGRFKAHSSPDTAEGRVGPYLGSPSPISQAGLRSWLKYFRCDLVFLFVLPQVSATGAAQGMQ